MKSEDCDGWRMQRHSMSEVEIERNAHNGITVDESFAKKSNIIELIRSWAAERQIRRKRAEWKYMQFLSDINLLIYLADYAPESNE